MDNYEAYSRLEALKKGNVTLRLPMGIAYVGYKNGEYVIKGG